MLAAAPLALVAAARVPLTLAVPVFLAGYGLVLALSPETNSLMAIGPYPWSGSRFYGVNNQIETLLLGPALAAGLLLRGWRLVALALLSLVVVGASKTGADGGGILVFATGFAVLAALLHGRARAIPLALLGVVALGLAFVGLDALAGGSSHVIDAVSGGPGELFDTFRDRAERSVSIVTSSVWQLAILAGGLAVLVYFATLKPRFPVVDAFLVAIARLPRRQRLADEGRGLRRDRLRRAARLVGFERARRDRIAGVRKLVLLLAALVLVVAIPACGGEEEEQALPETVEGTLPTDTGGAATEGDAEQRQGDLRVRRLRRLPHVLRGRLDRHGRAEPRRREPSSSTPRSSRSRTAAAGCPPSEIA